MPRIALIAISRLAPPTMQRVELPGHGPLVVIARDGEYFVTDDICSHGQASLFEGELIGHEILCPHHHGGFDIRSGMPTRAPCVTAVRSYAVRVDDGVLFIDTE